MTTLVALQQDGEVWIGADSRFTEGDVIVPVDVDKWIIEGRWGLGIAGTIRAYDVMRDKAPQFLKPRAAVKNIVMSMRSALRDDGFQTEPGSDGGECFGASFILAHRRLGVFSVGYTFDASPVSKGSVYADGSGREFAFGAGAACSGSPEERCRVALATACRFDIKSGEPLFLRKL